MGLSRQVHFSEYEYYSVMHDAEVCRVSIPDDNGREFFAIVPVDGKGYRERREAACNTIIEAIRQGCRPGEVRIRADV